MKKLTISNLGNKSFNFFDKVFFKRGHPVYVYVYVLDYLTKNTRKQVEEVSMNRRSRGSVTEPGVIELDEILYYFVLVFQKCLINFIQLCDTSSACPVHRHFLYL